MLSYKKVVINIHSLIKKGTAAVLCAGVILSAICASVGLTRRNDRVFEPRMTAPEYTNCYYYEENVFYNSGFGMPNCTAYAWGRVYEMLKTKPRLSTGNARDWYGYNKANRIYPYGNTPKLGAVACFDNEYGGHVAVVEEIDGDVITFSNSAYNGERFYLTYSDIYEKNPGQSGWEFQGYIYPSDFVPNNKRLGALRRISAADGLNFREYAGINADIIDVIPDGSDLYITTFFKENGYTWGKAYYDGNVGYCVIDYTSSV